MHVSVCMHACVNMCVHAHISVCVCVCVCVCRFKCLLSKHVCVNKFVSLQGHRGLRMLTALYHYY